MLQYPRFLFWGAAVAFLLGFAFMLFWFDYVDFYHRHFFEQGGLAQHYEWARLAFIFYFAWLIYAVGVGVLALAFGRQGLAKLPAWERYPLGFVLGVAVWSLPLYVAGLLSFYRKPLAVGLTLMVMAASIPHLAACIEEANARLGRLRAKLSFHVRTAITPERIRIEVPNPMGNPRGSLSALLSVLLLIAIGIAVAVLLLVKGLYPGGGHDYYNHYFPFYVRVIQTGSTLPNDVWYHFFLSKGDVLYFLAMLLTDPLAPQLVTAGFVICAACIIYALLRRGAPDGPLPLIGVLLFVAFFIYTPGPHEFMIEGGWGDLEKEHELTAVTLLALIWTLVRIFGRFEGDRRPWILGLHASIVATVLVTLQLGLLIGLYLFGYMVWFATKRAWREFAIAFFGGVTATVAMIIVLAINYALTGLILDQAVVFTWPITNVTKIAAWGPLLELIWLYKSMVWLMDHVIPWSIRFPWLLACYLRLELWWPLVVTALPLAAYRLVRSRAVGEPIKSSVGAACGALFWFSGAVALVAIFGGGRSQSISFYRLTSFAYAPTLCFGLLLCQFGFGEIQSRGLNVKTNSFTKKVATAGLAAILLISSIWIAVPAGKYGEAKGNFATIVQNAVTLWRGQYSLEQAYQNQQGWPGRLPWGGIYPGLVAPWRMLPPNTRIWSFHVWSYCMLPDCNVQAFFSFIFSPHWRTVYFDTPERAAAILHNEGLDYFFFSKEMRIDDPLSSTPFFSPDNIGKHLAIRWTDGTSYLLTWPGPDTRPIDENFLSDYREMTLHAQYPIWAIKKIADEIDTLEAKGEKLRPFKLPW